MMLVLDQMQQVLQMKQELCENKSLAGRVNEGYNKLANIGFDALNPDHLTEWQKTFQDFKDQMDDLKTKAG